MSESQTQQAGSVGIVDTDFKSKILQRIAENFRNNAELAMSTQHTKSAGTNYSMHTKSDPEITGDAWEQVFSGMGNPQQ